jgi:hypothetical protein
MRLATFHRSNKVVLSQSGGYMSFMMAPRTGAEGGQEMLNAPESVIAEKCRRLR